MARQQITFAQVKEYALSKGLSLEDLRNPKKLTEVREEFVASLRSPKAEKSKDGKRGFTRNEAFLVLLTEGGVHTLVKTKNTPNAKRDAEMALAAEAEINHFEDPQILEIVKSATGLTISGDYTPISLLAALGHEVSDDQIADETDGETSDSEEQEDETAEA